MEAKDHDLKAYAISLLMGGTSYRAIQAAVQEKYGQSVALSTLNTWANESPETAQTISQSHLRAIGHQRIRIAHKAGDLLEQRLDNGEVTNPEVTFGIASDKLDSMLRITQDEKKQNPQLEALRMELRQKSPHELVAMLAELPDDSPPTEPPSQQDIRRYHGLD